MVISRCWILEREVLKNLKVLFSVRSEDILVQDFGKSSGIVLETSKVLELKQKPTLSLLTAFVRENEAVFVFRQHTETSFRACLLISSIVSPGYQTRLFTSGHSTCPAVFLIFHSFLFQIHMEKSIFNNPMGNHINQYCKYFQHFS